MISTAESWHFTWMVVVRLEGGGGKRREGPARVPKPSLHVDHRALWACRTYLFSKLTDKLIDLSLTFTNLLPFPHLSPNQRYLFQRTNEFIILEM